MKKVKVSFSGLNDMLKFKNMGKRREEAINDCSDENFYKEANTNKISKELHPKFQHVVVEDIINEKWDCKTFVLKGDNCQLAPFKAGQFVNVYVKIDGVMVSRAYSISSSPKMALENEYRITVKAVREGLVSNYLLGTLDIGEKLLISGPSGNFTYNPLRDEQHIVGIAGGVGVTPFYSLAQAIIDGDEDCLLTLFYGVNKEDDILFLEQFDDIVSKTNKVKVVYVVRDDEDTKYEYGLINKKLIDKYVVSNRVSFYICGPYKMYTYLNEELQKYNLPNKFFRYERAASKSIANGKKFTITVKKGNDYVKFKAYEYETIMTALYRAKIVIPSNCHSGTCGLCRTKLLSGEVIMDSDYRRKADVKYNYIHPCVTKPKSDLVIEIN